MWIETPHRKLINLDAVSAVEEYLAIEEYFRCVKFYLNGAEIVIPFETDEAAQKYFDEVMEHIKKSKGVGNVD